MGFFDKVKKWDREKRESKAKEKEEYSRIYNQEYGKVRKKEIGKKARADARAKARGGSTSILAKANNFGMRLEKMDRNLERSFGGGFSGAPSRGKRKKGKDPMNLIFGD